YHRPSSRLARHFHCPVRLDHVAGFDVLELLETDAALGTGLDLADVVLEVLQRGKTAFPHHDVVPKQTCLGGAGDATLHYAAASHRSNLGNMERLTDLGSAQLLFAVRWLEQASHCLGQLLGEVVDDRVEPHVNLLPLGQLLRGALGTNVEADHNGLRGGGEEDVVRIDRTGGGVQDVDGHLF